MINFKSFSTLCISSTLEDPALISVARKSGFKRVYSTPPGLTWLIKGEEAEALKLLESLKKIVTDSHEKSESLIENLLPEIPFCKHIQKVSGKPPLLLISSSEIPFKGLLESSGIKTINLEDFQNLSGKLTPGNPGDENLKFDSPPSPDITGKIIETSPNGIVFLDENLEIIKMNRSFKSLFNCSDAITGKHISQLLDPEYFEELAIGNRTRIEKTGPCGSEGTICHQILYPLTEHKEYVGLYINITGRIKSRQDLEDIKQKAVSQAKELQEHQIEAAQQIVKLIGETAARGENLVSSLMSIFSNEHKDRKLKNIHREENDRN